MKIFIITIIIAVTAVSGEQPQQAPDEFQLLNPEFLRRTGWAHQAAYHELQDEIDQTITDINSMIASVLVSTTSSTINLYETHSNGVWDIHTDANNSILVLDPTECKDNLLRLNAEYVESTGYRGSNCITSFNKKTHNEVKEMSDIVNDINVKFGDVALSVYRSYIGVNPMVDGEAIERHINNTYIQVKSEWLSIKPDTSFLRTTLTNNINALTNNLNSCFTSATNYMNILADLVREQVNYCSNYGGSRFNYISYERFIRDFENVKINNPEYVW